jgi:uncharacterized protein YacL
MSQTFSEESLRKSMIEECQRIDSKYTVYKISGIYSAIIAGIVLIITIIWSFKISAWLKWIATIVLTIIIIYLGFLIIQSALVSRKICY